MPGVTATHAGGRGASASRSLRPFKRRLRPRLRRYREATATIPEGSVWSVRILEVGTSLNGVPYTEEAVQQAPEIFEGVSVYLYALDPTANAGHAPEEVADAVPQGLVGNKVGSLEGVHYNEEAKALDGFLKVYDDTLRTRMVAAYKLGDIGEGGDRDVFGLSIDAIGDENETGEVIRFTHANSVDVVSTPAAGGRIRRLIESLQKEAAVATTTKKVNLKEAVKAVAEGVVRVREQGTELEETALMNIVFDEAMRRISDIRWDDGDMSMQEKVAGITDVANQLGQVFGGPAPAPVEGEGEAVQEARKFREAAATLAGKLKLLADQLSAAPDEQAPLVLQAIKEAVDAEIAGTNQPTEEGQEADDMAKTDTQDQGTAKSQDEFARMSAGLTEVLKTNKLSKKVREDIEGLLGTQPKKDPLQAENEKLREQIREQAIQFAFKKLAEDLKVIDPSLVLSNIDREGIEISEENEVTGLKEAVTAFLKDRPYLIKVEEAVTDEGGDGTENTEGDGGEGGQQTQTQESADAAGSEGDGKGKTGQRKTEAAKNKKPMKPGVRVRESVNDDGKPQATPAKMAKLRKRALRGDPSAMTALRHARGHSY